MSSITVDLTATKLGKNYGTNIGLYPTETALATTDSTLLSAGIQIKLGELL
jgi:hypothetical protein